MNTPIVKELVEHYIYQPEHPNWGELMVALYDYGHTTSQVYAIMNTVREEGFAE
jgi:hypothetical protein